MTSFTNFQHPPIIVVTGENPSLSDISECSGPVRIVDCDDLVRPLPMTLDESKPVSSSTICSYSCSLNNARFVSLEQISTKAGPSECTEPCTPSAAFNAPWTMAGSKKGQGPKTKRSFSMINTNSSSSKGKTVLFASVFEEPSEFFRAKMANANAMGASEHQPKKQKTEHTKSSCSTLHEACRQGPNLSVEEVDKILLDDPNAASRSLQLTTSKTFYNAVTSKLDSKVIPEPYKFPLNLAIAYKCSTAVLERLIEAAPEVLSLVDGKSTSLHILLRHKPEDTTTVDTMLCTNSTIALWKDIYMRSALHQAICYGACLRTVQRLVMVNSQSLLERDFHGQIPLELAQRVAGICPIEVSNFLWKKVEAQF